MSAVGVLGSAPTNLHAAWRQYLLQFLTNFDSFVRDAETGELLEYQHLIKRPRYTYEWGYSFGNKIGQLAHGMPGKGRVEGTNTIFSSSPWKECISNFGGV